MTDRVIVAVSSIFAAGSTARSLGPGTVDQVEVCLQVGRWGAGVDPVVVGRHGEEGAGGGKRRERLARRTPCSSSAMRSMTDGSIT
ncbi:MAG: hypothetical protein V9G12_17805 [Microthrixaceae bacterium]